ncbi:MAG: hypothetical protein JXB35_12095 [Anaerolineae bacterium]|nr:hypothetical protein [Anaerolineae bacterium]
MESEAPRTQDPVTNSTKSVSVVTAEHAAREHTAAKAPPSQQTTEEQEKRIQLYIIGGAILILALLVTSIVLMANNAAVTEVIRDIAIVFVAVETFLIGMAALVLIVQIHTLTKVLREEIQPLLRSVTDTASTVRGTTEFVSENLVSPIIRVAGFAAAVRQVVGDLFGVVAAARPKNRSASVQQQGGKEDGAEG